MNLHALALEADVLGGAEIQPREKCLVVRGELAQPSGLERIHLGRRGIIGFEQRRVAPCRGQCGDDKGPGGNLAGDRAARQVDASGVLDAVVLHRDGDRRRIGREGEGGHRPIELVGKRARRAAGGRHQRQMILNIGVELRFEPLQVGDGSSVGTPSDLLRIRRVGMHDAARGGTGHGFHDGNVLPPVRIDGSFMRSNEGDPASVGGPGGQILIELRIEGQLLGVLAFHIEQVQVPFAPLRKISVPVLLEVQCVDHDGLGPRGRLALHQGEHETLAVRRPRILANVSLDAGDLAGISAAPVQQHELPLLGARRGCDKGKIAAIGAPARIAGAVRRGRQRQPLAAVPTHHPDRAACLVGFAIVRRHHIGDPQAVGRHLRIAHVLHAVEVVRRQRSARRRRIGGGGRLINTKRQQNARGDLDQGICS